MNPLVTVILPNYNHSEYLIERLNSVFNQTFVDFEVIILDDASTDNSIEILNNYKEHPKVSFFIVNEINSKSPFKQWLKGLRLAKGKYIWIAETDDFADYNFLETQIKCLEKADAAVAKTIIVNGLDITNEVVQHPIFSTNYTQQLLPLFYFTSPIKNISCIVFKNSKDYNRENLKFINYSIMGDQVFYYEFFMNKTICYNTHTNSYFRRSPNSVSNANSSKGIKYYLKYYEEHLRFAKLLDCYLPKSEMKLFRKKHFNKMKNNCNKGQKFNFRYFYYLIKNALN